MADTKGVSKTASPNEKWAAYRQRHRDAAKKLYDTHGSVYMETDAWRKEEIKWQAKRLESN